ncbi:MAG: asparagine synthetase B family protein, partial [bacterium]
LLKICNPARQPNEPIIYDYLHDGYVDHTGETFFAGIKQLLPAHALLLRGGRLSMQRYWDLASNRQAEPEMSDARCVEEFYALFEDAVRLHLRSDVAIGTCLSGGLDSSAIVCVANKLLFSDRVVSPHLIGKQQKTFSSCFDDPRFDERKHIEQVLQATGAEPNYIFPSGAKLLEILPRLVWHQDEPFVSTSIYAQWCVMEKAADRGVKVLLDGQGGDELLAGYPEYFTYFWVSLLRQGRLVELWQEALAYHRRHHVALRRVGLRIARNLAPSAISACVDRERHEADWGLSRDFLERHRHRRAELSLRYFQDPFHDHLYALLTRFSLPSLLRYEDRNAMAFSIEARVPFLDYRLVEYAFSLPANQKIKGGMTKAILRAALRDILPEPVRMRTDKMGFVTPESLWLSNHLKGWMREIVSSSSFRRRGYFDAPKIWQALEAHTAGKRDWSYQAWRWLNLELWFRQIIEEGKP